MDELYTGYRRRKADAELDESFSQCPRYDKHELSDEQIEEIAERAAKKAIEMAKTEFYTDVGHTVINKFYWLVGIVVAGSFLWLNSKGFIKL
jgi:hypothetical protein